MHDSLEAYSNVIELYIASITMTTVNVEISAQYIFSRISRMALCARKYDVSEKINQTRTKRTNIYLREILVARKCLLRLDARKFSCAKISTFTVLVYLHLHCIVNSSLAMAIPHTGIYIKKDIFIVYIFRFL